MDGRTGGGCGAGCWSRTGRGAAIPIADHIPAINSGNAGTVPNAAPPLLDPNRLFAVDGRYDDALRRVRVTPPHFGVADAPVPAMLDGGYQPGLAFLMQRIVSARPEDLPQLYADIRALHMQPGAHRTGEALIRAAGDAAEAGSDLRARREILGDIAPIAKSDPLQLAVDEFGTAAGVLPEGGAGSGAKAAQEVKASLAGRMTGDAGTAQGTSVKSIPGFTEAESSVIAETQAALQSKNFQKLQEFARTGTKGRATIAG